MMIDLMRDPGRRSRISTFLKSARARIAPGDVGLPVSVRRRTPGLRREDVAAIAGVSVTWYTWLEQGRDVRVSADVLERVARALQLSPDEREYLFELAQNRPPPLSRDTEIAVPPAVKRMIAALPVPALVMTFRWDVVAWNKSVVRYFRDYGALSPAGRNLLRILFSEPQYREDPEEFQRMARRVLAKLRVDCSQAGDDPALESLIREMCANCPTFARLWEMPEVSTRSEGTHSLRHPEKGLLTFEHTSYVPEGYPGLRLVVFAPARPGGKTAPVPSHRPWPGG